MKTYLILTNPYYNVHHKPWRHTSDYDSFSNDDTAEMVQTWGHCLKLRGRDHMFSSAVQPSSWLKAFFASTEEFIVLYAKGNVQECDDSMFK